ncbi:MAG: murein hydrolase activator EnvC family protein [Gemmatimonadales bacterium]
MLRLGCVLAVLATAPLAAPLAAQGNIDERMEESRERLAEIRREREKLQTAQERLRGQGHTLEQEVNNLERQTETTGRIVRELESQIGTLNSQVDSVSRSLQLAQDNLVEKRAVLERRLVDIYKRGPLHSVQVLLAAESFGDLLSRYKYLYLTSRQDRALEREVEELRDRVQRQRNEIVQVRTEFDRRRDERENELRRYGILTGERERRLRAVRRTAQSTDQRLSELDRDEARLNDLLESLARAARNAGGGNAPADATITTADIGRLDWPVEGAIVYNFGRETLTSGAVIRHNGIGIGAPAGTTVKAVEGGVVEVVQVLGTYGLSVFVLHGNGYRSLYMQLSAAAVKVGEQVTRGQIIGTVGGQNSDAGPHLHFEIRGTEGDISIALDPAEWLRNRE